MPAKLLWTPQAEEDLLDIYYFIALDNPERGRSNPRRVAVQSGNARS